MSTIYPDYESAVVDVFNLAVSSQSDKSILVGRCTKQYVDDIKVVN